jgi:CBS domain containing-hemolysin-like protein
MINIMYLTFKPLIYVMKLSSNALLRLFGQSNLEGHGESHFTMSVEEIRMILSASEKDGTLDKEETEMIRGVFKLDEHTVREAMVPRTRIRALSNEDTLADALRVFRDVPHARFPVYDKSLDRITGVVAIKELLTVMAESTGQTLEEVSQRPVSEFVQAPYIVPNSKTLSDLLKEFKRTRQQMAVVIDEYGGTEGIITLEDILEEIVGEITDEFDVVQKDSALTRTEDGAYLIDGAMTIRDLNRATDWRLPDDEANTIAGLVIHEAQMIPNEGQVFSFHGFRFTVVSKRENRITKLKLRPL